MKYIGLLILGIVIGWLLHEISPYFLSPVSPQKSVTGPTAIYPQGGTDGLKEKSIVVGPETGAVANPTTPTVSEDESPSRSEFSENIIADFKSGNIAWAVSQCSRGSGQFKRDCRRQLVEYSKSGSLSKSDSKYLLELWMAENPDDIDVGILLVDREVQEERFVEAAERLALMKSYQTEIQMLDTIAQQTQNFARKAISKLDLKRDLMGLQSLLVELIGIDPSRAAWRYSLARVQNDLKQYDDAINTLSYILFDPEYGDRANQLYEIIADKLNLASYAEVALHNSGSQFLVRASINGPHAITLILDTGASITTVKTETLQRLGLISTSDRVITLNTVGGKVQASLVTLNSLSIGGQVVRGLDVASTNLDGIQADGLLGMNFLEHFRFIIDQKQRKLYLERK